MEEEGCAGLLSGPVRIVLLDWCRKIWKSDLSLIFFYILDEAATHEQAIRVFKKTTGGYLPFTVGFALAWRLVGVFTPTSRWCNADLTGVENIMKAP